MDFPPSPPVLYLEDDDHEQMQYPELSRSFIPSVTSTEAMHRSQKKRKYTNPTLMASPSVAAHWPKRNRIDPFDQRLMTYPREPGSDPEPIILDPDEYVIEEPDTHSFRAFDWTIEPRRTSAPIRPRPIFPGTRIVDAPTSAANHVQYVAERTERLFRTSMNNPTDKGHLQQRKSTAVPMVQPPLPPAPLSLPLPSPASLLVRAPAKRGRPLKASRIAHVSHQVPFFPFGSGSVQLELETSPPSVVRQAPEPVLVPPPARSSTYPAPSEPRRQLLHGTGIFSAFHDSKYYRCNICKFKSVTSSTLLQHLFTHVFFCQHCAFYTYSHYQLSQHMFEKHDLNLIEDISDPLDPKTFDLLYLTRCADGTFALCMDAAVPSSSKYSHDQQLILSSTTLNDQPMLKATKKSSTKEDRAEPDKRETTARPLAERTTVKETFHQNYIVIRHRRFYSLKKSPALHALTLEYNICRERFIRHLSRTQTTSKRGTNPANCDERRLIDEIAHCLRTTVNQIVDNEENSDHPSLICALPNQVLSSIVDVDDLSSFTDALKLTNKYARALQGRISDGAEQTRRQRDNQIFVLSSPTANSNEQAIIVSLHSSMTNGDSYFVQTKFEKLPLIHDNTHRFFKASPAEPPRSYPSKTLNKGKISTPTPTAPIRPPLPKPSPSSASSLPTATRVDRNNNSIPSAKSKPSSSVSNVIVLD